MGQAMEIGSSKNFKSKDLVFAQFYQNLKIPVLTDEQLIKY